MDRDYFNKWNLFPFIYMKPENAGGISFGGGGTLPISHYRKYQPSLAPPVCKLKSWYHQAVIFMWLNNIFAAKPAFFLLVCFSMENVTLCQNE